MPEVVTGVRERPRQDPLIGQGQFVGPALTEQDGRRPPRDGDESGAAQDRTQDAGELGVRHRLGGRAVDRPRHRGVDDRAQVDVGEVVQRDPRHPLSAGADTATEPRARQGRQRRQHPAGPGQGDAGADGDDPGTGLAGGVAVAFPVDHDVGDRPGPRRGVLGQLLVTAVGAVVADGRGTDHGGGPVAGGDELGEATRGADAAVADPCDVTIGEPARDGCARQVDQHVHAVEQIRGGGLRIPAPLRPATASVPGDAALVVVVVVVVAVVLADRSAHQADDAVAGHAEQGRQGRAHQSGGTGHGDRHRRAAVAVDRGQVGGHLPVPVGEHGGEGPAGDAGLDPVAEERFTVRSGGDGVRVDPAGRGGVGLRHAAVDEALPLHVAGGIVPGVPPGTEAPAQRAGQGRARLEHREAVPQGRRLPDRTQRHERRGQSAERTRGGEVAPRLPGRRGDRAGQVDAHRSLIRVDVGRLRQGRRHSGEASPRPPAIGTVRNAQDHQPRSSMTSRTVAHCPASSAGSRLRTKPDERVGSPTIASE